MITRYCEHAARRSAARSNFVDRVILLLAVIAFTVSYCTPTPADELILHGPSYHFDRSSNFNNDNYGIGYVLDNGVVAGTFRNSLDNQTLYAGYLWRFHPRVGLIVGAATGYEYPIVPAAILNFNAPISKQLSLHLNILPIKQGVANLAIGYQFGNKGE